ncbi:MAG: hypothetical protein GSR86_04835 [Desulfurococcales archaeon]|nr:hypothetical protein [Desulfurococcales archaeon]
MERIRVDECLLIDTLRRGLHRIHRGLGEAVDRIPPHTSGRGLVESGLELSMGLINIAEELSRRCRESGG